MKMFNKRKKQSLGLVLGICAGVSSVMGHSLTKLVDFNNNNFLMANPQGPNDSPVWANGTLWFTTESGGLEGFGTLCSYNTTSGLLQVVHSTEQVTGNTPKANPVVDGNLLYFTTIKGGTGDKGTLAAWDTVAQSHTLLWHSPQQTPNTNPNQLQGDVAIVDRGAMGKDIYFMTINGGAGTGIGTIQRYQTADGSVSQVYAFPGLPGARQPFKGFSKVGAKLYFTTFTGGLSGSGYGNGAGTLCELDVSTRGAETFTQLAAMPSGDGSLRFPAHNPYYRSVDHCLYFTCTGSATQPGSLMKYDLSAGVLSTLHEIAPAVGSLFPEGKFCYGSVAEWDDALYFTTIQGGTYNGGTINRYHLRTKTHEVLYHLDSDHAVNAANPYDNIGGEMRGGACFNESSSAPAFYFLCKQGGIHDHGTLVRLNLDAPQSAPSAYEMWWATQPSLSTSAASPSADPDGDGIPNHTEFAFGTNPQASEGSSLRTMISSNQFEITFTARVGHAAEYVCQSSGTLGVAPEPWSTIATSSTVLSGPDIVVPSGYERRRFVVAVTNPRSFFRVICTVPPNDLP